jgi:hypothetical protein
LSGHEYCQDFTTVNFKYLATTPNPNEAKCTSDEEEYGTRLRSSNGRA